MMDSIMKLFGRNPNSKGNSSSVHDRSSMMLDLYWSWLYMFLSILLWHALQACKIVRLAPFSNSICSWLTRSFTASSGKVQSGMLTDFVKNLMIGVTTLLPTWKMELNSLMYNWRLDFFLFSCMLKLVPTMYPAVRTIFVNAIKVSLVSAPTLK